MWTSLQLEDGWTLGGWGKLYSVGTCAISRHVKRGVADSIPCATSGRKGRDYRY